jgi:hypothetical protein
MRVGGLVRAVLVVLPAVPVVLPVVLMVHLWSCPRLTTQSRHSSFTNRRNGVILWSCEGAVVDRKAIVHVGNVCCGRGERASRASQALVS